MKMQKRGSKKLVIVVASVITVIAVILGLTGWFLLNKKTDKIAQTITDSITAEPQTYHGKTPNCPEKYCLSLTVNGDLLFHPKLWDNFVTDDGGYDFTSLFAAEMPYYAESDIVVCDMETPIAPLGGPYVGYPVFNIPPQVVDYAKKAGYTACTTDTNHSFDRGSEGIARMIDKLDEVGIAHTGTYKTEEESQNPLILDAEGGKLAIIGGTVSINGQTADNEWQIDRMREGANHDSDFARMIGQAKKARENGANIVVAQLHSVQEYITKADSWQISIAHELAESGEFDAIYFHGSHSVEPIENYDGTWIVYGVGNSVSTAVGNDPERYVNDQGLTVRFTFASDDQKSWKITNLAYLPTYVKNGANPAWCPLVVDNFTGCGNDAAMYSRMDGILHSMGVPVDDPILRPWKLGQ